MNEFHGDRFPKSSRTELWLKNYKLFLDVFAHK